MIHVRFGKAVRSVHLGIGAAAEQSSNPLVVSMVQSGADDGTELTTFTFTDGTIIRLDHGCAVGTGEIEAWTDDAP